MNKKKIFGILICIAILVLFYLGFLLSNYLKYVGYTQKYLKEEKFSNSEKSPKNIHVVLAKYDGNLSPITITKQLYNIATNIIPYYANFLQGKGNFDMEYIFKHNREIINLNLGIEEIDDFKALKEDLKSLSGELNLESYRIDIPTVKNIPGWTKFDMYVKYKGKDEIKLKVAIYNRYGKNNEIILKVM